MYKIVITKPAEQDLRKAVQYVSVELQNPAAAVTLITNMEEAISTLAQMPLRHPLVQDDTLAAHGFRFMVVMNYLVFYIVREATNSVVVERILYGRRNWQTLL